MPIERCKRNGQLGYRFGTSGKCFVGAGALAKARRQERAIRASGFTENTLTENQDERTKVVPSNPLKADPTRTATLRRKFIADLRRHFRDFAQALRQLVVEEDAFGLKPVTRDPFVGNVNDSHDSDRDIKRSVDSRTVANQSAMGADQEVRATARGGGTPAGRAIANETALPDDVVLNQRFRFLTDQQKVDAFRDWLSQNTQNRIIGVTPAQIDEAWWQQYVEEGYRKGAGRAFDDTTAARKAIATTADEISFFGGTKEQFLRQAFGQPVAVEKVKLLTGRVFTELKGVTDEMSRRMTRVLADGLVQGEGLISLGNKLRDEIGISDKRAEMIARTEIVRVHGQAQLDSLEQMGVEEVGVAVEWSTAGDDRTCPKCSPLEGVVMKLSEARGLIPRHPNCLPGDSLVTSSSAIAALSKRWFDGNLIVIKTADRREIVATPNHPILTDCGWLGVSRIKKGSRLVCQNISEGIATSNFDYVQNGPSRIEDVFEAFILSRHSHTFKAKVSPQDFHGDGSDGEVTIIMADGFLADARYVSLFKHLYDALFVWPGQRLFAFACACTSQQLGLASLISGLGFSSNARLSRSQLMGHSRHAETSRVGFRSQDSGSLGVIEDGTWIDVEEVRDGITAESGSIHFDDVVDIGFREFHGYVYNLETRDGKYGVNGITTHNCRCAYLPSLGLEKGQQRSKTAIDESFRQSLKAEIPKRSKRTIAQQKKVSKWAGADTKIAKKRPKFLESE